MWDWAGVEKLVLWEPGLALPQVLSLLGFSAFANPKEVEFSLSVWLTCSYFALLMDALKCISLFWALG